MDRTQHVIDAIDGALADDEFPDAMRWSPEPETVDDAPAPFDGSLVWQPPQRYELLDPRGGPRHPDLPVYDGILDEAYLVDPAHRAEVIAERERLRQRVLERSMWWTPSVIDEEQADRLLERLGEAMQPVMEAAERVAASMGMSVEQFAENLAELLPPAADAEDEDPEVRALRLRQRRNTGPDRDVVRQRRPRLVDSIRGG